MPTAVALTVSASGIQIAPETKQPTPLAETSLSPTPNQKTPEVFTSTPSIFPTEKDKITQSTQITNLAPPQLSPTNPTPASIPTHTPAPIIPEARIQIFRHGERSLVTSPIQVYARLTSKTGKIVRIELFGEDGRLLARQIKVYQQLPWHVSSLLFDLDYEIKAAAEAGRLVISVEDVYGRLMDLNSVNLILLSNGVTELNPATALYERVVVQEPDPNTLIQGGIMIVNGLAQPSSDQPLRIALIGEDGRTLGSRLAGIQTNHPGGYGEFLAEVPYSVSELTPALLVVYEESESSQQKIYLTSIEVNLSP